MEGLVITPEIEADAQRLAEAMGTTPTEAVAAAVRSRVSQLDEHAHTAPSMEALLAVVHRKSAANAEKSRLSEDEILGYNEFGVFD